MASNEPNPGVRRRPRTAAVKRTAGRAGKALGRAGALAGAAAWFFIKELPRLLDDALKADMAAETRASVRSDPVLGCMVQWLEAVIRGNVGHNASRNEIRFQMAAELRNRLEAGEDYRGARSKAVDAVAVLAPLLPHWQRQAKAFLDAADERFLTCLHAAKRRSLD